MCKLFFKKKFGQLVFSFCCNFWTTYLQGYFFSMLAESNFFFSVFLYSAQDLSQKIGLWTLKSWTLLIRVSIYLIVEVHGVNGVGEEGCYLGGANFVHLSHWFIFKYWNCITSALRGQAFLQFVPRACFEKPLKNSKNVSNFSSCYSKLCLFFVLFWWRDKYQRNEKFDYFFPVTKDDKV